MTLRFPPMAGGHLSNLTNLRHPPRVPARLALVLLLAATLGLGLVAGTVARPVFVLGSLVVGYLAWREGAARSVECAIYLFCLAPFLRRVADHSTNYEPYGVMLLGPLLALAVPAVELRDLVLRRRAHDADLAPMLLVGACVLYAWALSAFPGDIGASTIAATKSLIPMLYGVWVMRAARQEAGIIDAAARAFLVATPLMGLYGLIQYVSPWPWDRHWMLASRMATIGLPEPYQLRVFSTMNAPASFATFSAVGLLLFGFCRSGWQSVVLALPVSLGLLLSMYRTAWISLAVGVLYCAAFRSTRTRAGLIVAAIAVAILLAAGSTEFGQIILDRLATLAGPPAEDGSGRERLAQFIAFYNRLDESLVGRGFVREQFNGTNALDGEVMAALITQGLLVGTLMIAGMFWAALQALRRIGDEGPPTRIVAGAVICGLVAGMPLASVSTGEIGMLFWTFVGVASARYGAARCDPAASAAQSRAGIGVVDPGRDQGG